MESKIAIVGAGIGGLTAAIALRRMGFSAELYERASELKEVGAAIALWPNATRVLRDLGVLDALLARSDLIQRCEIRTWKGLPVKKWRVPKLETPAVFTHRADLQTVLAGAVPEDSIHLGRTGRSIEQNGQTVRLGFAEGGFVDCHVLVGADGLRSAVREALHGRHDPVYQGYTQWRAIVTFGDDGLQPGDKIEWWGAGIRFGIAMNGLGRMNWYVSSSVAGSRDVPRGGYRAFLLRLLQDWDEPVRRILEATAENQMLKTDIWALPPTNQWGRGGVTLLGDAAHPTTPNLGQGAGMAIEDAAVLADGLARHGVGEGALRAYEKRRRERTAATTRRSKFVGDMGQWSHPVAVAFRTFFLKSFPNFLWERKLREAYSWQR